MSELTKTILLVEDDEFYLSLIKEWIHASGHSVLTANDGHEALNICQNQAVDLIITDVFMPSMDGIELLRNVKLLHPTILVLVISGKLRAVDFMKAAAKFGAAITLQKPLDKESFMATVNKILTP